MEARRSRRREEAERAYTGGRPPPHVGGYERSGARASCPVSLRLPLPMRHERGEGRGEGCPTTACGPL